METHLYPEWLHVLSVVSLVFAVICAAIIVVDLLAGKKQHEHRLAR